MELSELDTDSMLGKNQSGVTSMALGSGAGGVKVMGGQQSGFGDAPTFEVSKNIESFEEPKETPKFKPATKKETPKFKPAAKKETPKFKPAAKKEGPKFKKVN